jgi:hypothetical protein
MNAGGKYITDKMLALVVLKIFSREFMPIGTVYTVYGLLVLAVALYRRRKAEALIVHEEHHDHIDYFETSGNSVLALSVISISSYITLIVLLSRLT